MKVRLSALKEYLSVVLVEGRVDDAREKYPDMDDDAFEFLVANQPAGSNNKYLMWACKQAEELLENDPDPQGLRIVTQAIRLFDGNKQRLEKKDLNQYKDTEEVESAVAKLGGASKGQQSKEAKANSDLIYNDDRFTVIRPHTTEASCKYGIGTKWCIAATASTNYFNSYSESNNKFYFVIDKQAQPNSTNSKFAIVILEPVNEDSERHIQVFNAADNQVGLKTVINHVGPSWTAMWTKIKEHVAAHPITREVEESRKETKEHLKALLKGDKVSNKGLEKIAKNVELTVPVVAALIKRMREYTGPRDYTDPRNIIINELTRRATELPPEGALELVKYVESTKPQDNTWWGNRYNLEQLIKKAPLPPEAFFELAKSANEETLTMIMNNSQCPTEIIDALTARLPELRDKHLKREVYLARMRKGTITPEQMSAAVSGDDTYAVIYSILHQPSVSENLTPELLRLVPTDSAENLKSFLKLGSVTPELAAERLGQKWGLLKRPELYELLRSIALPTSAIENLWSNKDQHIRVALLQNPAIGADNAKKFADSRNSAYRFAVAHNPALPTDNLKTLAGDESASTRAAVGSNPATPTDSLKVLARDEATVVRASVASNAKTPTALLHSLAKDSDDFVRKSARKTLKSLQTTETFIRMSLGMQGHLLKEELTDDSEMQDIMTPDWSSLPSSAAITVPEFVAVVLLQNNGSATREEIEEAFGRWSGRPQFIGSSYSRHRRHGSGRRRTEPQDVWKLINYAERHMPDEAPRARTISSQGKGWFWSPPGINKGSIYRLTPTGAAAAMHVLQRVRDLHPNHQWPTRPTPAVKTSSPAPEPSTTRQAYAEPGVPRGPKTTYKVYGRFKGHPVSTRLKGQAYVGPANTRFAPGEQAVITKNDDGKLSVKKADSDHTQTWEPIDG